MTKNKAFPRHVPTFSKVILWLYDPRYKDISTCSYGRWPSLVSAGGQDFPDVSTCSSLCSLISSSSLLRYVLVQLHFVLTEKDEYVTVIVYAITVSICVRSWNCCYYVYNAVSMVRGSFRQSQRAVVQLRCLSVCTAVLQTGCTSVCVFLRPVRWNVLISVHCDLVLCAVSLFAVVLLRTLTF